MPATIGPIEITGAALFALAVLHTFSTRYFEHLAHTRTAHAGVWHLLGEVETVFGFWAFVLLLFMALAYGWGGMDCCATSRLASAATSSALANGFCSTVLCGTPFAGHSVMLSPVT